jgi:competence ComEA-like helix-hairpin-helix protein
MDKGRFVSSNQKNPPPPTAAQGSSATSRRPPRNRLLALLGALFFLGAIARESRRIALEKSFVETNAVRGTDDRFRIDLNSAGIDELIVLPQIGPSLARRIVEFRRVFGPFENVDDLARIPGIGPEFAEGLARFVTTRACPR